jgi:hypothetical protein
MARVREALCSQDRPRGFFVLSCWQGAFSKGARGLGSCLAGDPQPMPSAALDSAKFSAAGSTAIAETHNAGYALACRSIRGAVAASAMAIMLSMVRMARAT